MNQRRFEQSSNTSAGMHLAKLLRVMKTFLRKNFNQNQLKFTGS